MAAKRKKYKSIIKNYGVMWERDRVFWGTGGKGKKGTLLGSRPKQKNVDFHDQIGVYVLYDHAMKPIYVGQAGSGHARLFDRLKSHSRGPLRQRWKFFSWFGFLAINKTGKLSGWDKAEKSVQNTVRGALNEIEGVLIEAIEPAFNKKGSSFITSEAFKQVDDPDLELTSNKRIEEEQKEQKERKEQKKILLKFDKEVGRKLDKVLKYLGAIRKKA